MPETDETILSRLLSNSQVEAVHDIYTKHDAAAMAAQSTFRRYSLIFIAATALASLVAALILFGSGADPGAGDGMSGFLADPSRRDILFTVEVAA